MLDRTDHISEARDGAIFRGCAFSHQEIVLAAADMIERARILGAAAKTFDETFLAQNMDELKRACDSLAVAADDVRLLADQVGTLARSLSTTFSVHLARIGRRQ